MSDVKFKLVIWDFDGVIADTEKLWLKTRMDMLNEKFNLNWDFQTAAHYIAGMGDKTKSEVLAKLGIETDDAFWEEALKRDYQYMLKGFDLTKGIRKIFEYNQAHQIKQCIATGGILSKTLDKINIVKINDIFDETQIFTVDMVEHGKPKPDIFLLAAKKMKVKPENCVVIEDSLAGLQAAVAASMTPVAFIGSDITQTPEFQENLKKLNIKNVFQTMDDVFAFLQNHY